MLKMRGSFIVYKYSEIILPSQSDLLYVSFFYVSINKRYIYEKST